MTEESILKEIEEDGFFSFFPERWEKYGPSVDKLEEEGKIEKLSKSVKTGMNTSYFFVFPGNPREVNWVPLKRNPLHFRIIPTKGE